MLDQTKATVFRSFSPALHQHVFVMLMREFQHMLAHRGLHMATVFSGDCQFEQAGNFGSDYRSLAQSLANERFRIVAATFIANVDRVGFLAAMPIQLIYWTGLVATTTCATRVACGGTIEDSSKDSAPEFEERWNAIFREKIDNTNERGAWSRGAQQLNALLSLEPTKSGVNPAEEGVQACLAAILTGSYAALETLAADLWIEAVDQFPRLAKNWVKKNPEKQILANVLAGSGFNLSDRMGRTLHDTRKVSFESWNDIKRAYSHAFEDALDGVFDPPERIFKVEKTRHLFAHRGGIVDRQFKEQMKEFPEFADVVQGERLRLTGPVVRDYLSSCIACACALAQQVDSRATSA